MALDKFISSVKTEGLARNSRFRVVLSLPAAIRSSANFNQELEKVLLYCDTASLPGLSLSTTQSRTFGEFREIPYEKTFEPLNLTFYVDVNMTVKYMFDAWLAYIINPSTKTVSYYKNYVVPIDIYVEDIMNNTKYQCRMNESYPKSVGAIALDYSSRDIMKLSVSFAYRNFDTIRVSSSNNVSSDPIQVPKTYFQEFKAFQGRFNDFNNVFQNDVIQRVEQNIDTELGYNISV